MTSRRRWLAGLVVGIATLSVGCRPIGLGDTEIATPTAVSVAAAAAVPVANQTAVPGATQTAVPVATATAAPIPTQTAVPEPTATQPPKAPRVIAVDPGHGGPETGAVHVGRNGKVDLVEKNVNLAIALYLADDLSAAGYVPVLTRTEDSAVNVPPRDLNGDGKIDNDDDLQARVDIANRAGAGLLLSIHNNGAGATRRGTKTYFSQSHPLGERGKALAGFIQKRFVSGLKAAGYDDVIDEGISDDAPLGKPFGHLFVIGPKTPRVARVSKMPGVVGETLFVTNDTEAALLATRSTQQAIALAYARGVDDYFQRFPE